MSAYLDKSQGITFVYSNIYQLYKKAQSSKGPVATSRVIKSADADVSSFEPKEFENAERTFPVPMGVREAEEKAKALGARPLSNLKKNLSELTDAHEKLRFLLLEIETLTKKK